MRHPLKSALPVLAAVAALGVGGIAPATQALAQNAQQGPQMNAPAQTTQPSEQKLQSFAVAALEVSKLNQFYSQKLQQAGTPEEQTALRREATGKMTSAIKQEGLTIEEYKVIFATSRRNPDVAQKIQGYMQEEAKDQGLTPKTPAQ